MNPLNIFNTKRSASTCDIVIEIPAHEYRGKVAATQPLSNRCVVVD